MPRILSEDGGNQEAEMQPNQLSEPAEREEEPEPEPEPESESDTEHEEERNGRILLELSHNGDDEVVERMNRLAEILLFVPFVLFICRIILFSESTILLHCFRPFVLSGKLVIQTTMIDPKDVRL
jgi:hypothetical protein